MSVASRLVERRCAAGAGKPGRSGPGAAGGKAHRHYNKLSLTADIRRTNAAAMVAPPR
jgi:hypothetical protein